MPFIKHHPPYEVPSLPCLVLAMLIYPFWVAWRASLARLRRSRLLLRIRTWAAGRLWNLLFGRRKEPRQH